MNEQCAKTRASLMQRAVSLSLLLLACGSGEVFAQNIDDYTAEPPFVTGSGNSPSGTISTIAAAELAGVGALYQASFYKSYA